MVDEPLVTAAATMSQSFVPSLLRNLIPSGVPVV